MYESFFGLQQEPFSIAPDPRFLYLSERHREALALLSYGLARGGSFVLLTGEIGAGKTTVWRRFLDDLPSNVDVANVVNPKLGVDAMLARIFEDLQVELPAGGSAADMIDVLHGHLLLAHARGRRLLIVIDEAQALGLEVLEQLRLLTNLDWSGSKLQVMLIGQPEMRRMLERPELEPLAQRIVARYHLEALSESETAAYIAHRLHVAGLLLPIPFDGEALALIHRLSGGIPRRINVLCDRALALAHSGKTRHIGREIVGQAARQAFGGPPRPAAAAPRGTPQAAQPPTAAPAWPKALALVAGAGALFAAGGWLLPHLDDAAQRVPAVASGSSRPMAPTASAPAAASAAANADAVPAVAALPATQSAPSLEVAAPRPAPAVLPAQASPPQDAAPAQAIPSTSDEGAALRLLAGRWGFAAAGADTCAALGKDNVACYRARGGLTTIRQLDRPSVLHLVDAQGRPAYAVLVALRGDAATVAAAGTRRELALADLALAWRGEFTTLWHTPPGWRDGESGAVDRVWLAQQLAAAGMPANGATLQERLIAFQLAQGLTPDGVAGPLTLMRLNRATGVAEPRL